MRTNPLPKASPNLNGRCERFEPTNLSALFDRLKSLFLGLNDGSFDQLEHLMPLARWAANNQSDLTIEEFHTFQKCVAGVVRSEVKASFYPNAASIWTDMKEMVEELQDRWSMNFDREIEMIDLEIEGADDPETSSDQVGIQIERAKRVDIGSIIDSLLE